MVHGKVISAQNVERVGCFTKPRDSQDQLHEPGKYILFRVQQGYVNLSNLGYIGVSNLG